MTELRECGYPYKPPGIGQTTLKPCPFCGGSNVAERYDDGYVSCADCHAYGPEGGEKAWNTRITTKGDTGDD